MNGTCNGTHWLQWFNMCLKRWMIENNNWDDKPCHTKYIHRETFFMISVSQKDQRRNLNSQPRTELSCASRWWDWSRDRFWSSHLRTVDEELPYVVQSRGVSSSGSSQTTAAPSQCDYQGEHQTLKGKIYMNTPLFYKLAPFSKMQHVFQLVHICLTNLSSLKYRYLICLQNK